MKLNYYLFKYDFDEKHKIIINSSPEKVFEAIHNLDMSKSIVIKTLFLLRSIYGRLNPCKKPENQLSLGLSFEELIKKSGFIPLEEVRDKEIIMGIIGKFWQPAGSIIRNLKSTGFVNFNQSGYCKVAWNIYVEKNSDGTLNLSTETRIFCLGRRAKFLFFLYWMVIRPFSGWTRLEMLRMIKGQAEEKAT